MNKRYENDPILYAKEQLKIDYIWDEMATVAKSILEPPYRTLLGSAHGLGKTFCAAWLTNWHFDTFNPGVTITTAPSKRDVEDLLWKEVRVQRERAGLPSHFIGPSAPEMRTGPGHYAKGYTANKNESFAGRHDERMFFLFDESSGVQEQYWRTTKTMFKRDGKHHWLCIFNPLNKNCQAYQEWAGNSEDDMRWRTFSFSALDHPNIAAELRGESPPIPGAVTVSQIDDWIADWCMPIAIEEKRVTDILWRGHWYRPGPEFEARALGLWPSSDFTSVWSDALWNACVNMEAPPPPIDLYPELGIDCARDGEGADNTDFHFRWGCRSLVHESVNGWNEESICGRAIEICREWIGRINEERTRLKKAPLDYRQVPIKVDDDGTGGAVCNLLVPEGMNVVPVKAGGAAMYRERYPNKRSELWFSTVEKGKLGLISLGNLDNETLYRLRLQAMAPTWELNRASQRVIEDKKKTRARLSGKSPDGMDAMNLAYYEGGMWEAPASLKIQRTEMEDKTFARKVGPYETLATRPRARHGTSIGSRLFRRQ